MSFDPKLVREEAHFQFDGRLPEDLAALGQQLCDDAAHLGHCYPADARRPRVESPRSADWIRTWWPALIAASVMLAIGLPATYLLSSHVWQDGTSLTQPAQPSSPGLPVLPQPGSDTVAIGEAAPNVDQFPGQFADQTDAVEADVEHMSGAELEAYLDLLEEQQIPTEALSF